MAGHLLGWEELGYGDWGGELVRTGPGEGKQQAQLRQETQPHQPPYLPQRALELGLGNVSLTRLTARQRLPPLAGCPPWRFTSPKASSPEL